MGRRAYALGAITLLVLASCGAASPQQSAPEAPAHKPPSIEIITPVTGWQEMKLDDKDEISYRLVVITTPKGEKVCAIQSEMTSLGNPTLTVIPGNCV